MARDTARPRVLLTGFGPFPGVPENPSGWLAETLAGCARAHDWDLHGVVLPTEWAAVAGLSPRLHAELQPLVTIHFGVSARSKGLRIERAAHNRADPRSDARGAKPDSHHIAADGAARLETRLPVTTLAARLRDHGHAARASHTCGRYLCNFLYYRSLAQTKRDGGDALFVHIPLTKAQGGALDQDALLHAGADTLRFVLEAAQTATPPPARDASLAVEAQL
jgi:pyroglutamyl-peptidase